MLAENLDRYNHKLNRISSIFKHAKYFFSECPLLTVLSNQFLNFRHSFIVPITKMLYIGKEVFKKRINLLKHFFNNEILFFYLVLSVICIQNILLH